MQGLRFEVTKTCNHLATKKTIQLTNKQYVNYFLRLE